MCDSIEKTTLHIAEDLRSLKYCFPSSYYDADFLGDIFERKNISFQLTQIENSLSELAISRKEGSILEVAREGFSEYNYLPCFPSVNSFSNSTKPLVSCIILLTGNDYFVRSLAIPSLICNSSNHEIEIIIVYNGPRSSLEEFAGFEVVHSDFGWVAKGYNAGVKKANGEYIAIFHDDCLIQASNWIERCIEKLNEEVWAVTTEYRCMSSPYPIRVAKNTPLFMRKDVFDSLGGYDENYYFGVEDVDFTHLILSKGKMIVEMDLNIFHGAGMSTIIFISKKAHLYQQLFGLNAFSLSQLKLIQNYYKKMFAKDHDDSLMFMSKYKLYFLEKFWGYFEIFVEPQQLKQEYQNLKASVQKNHLPTQDELMRTWKLWTKMG